MERLILSGKLNSGVGDYYGTFHGPWERFDPAQRPQGPLIFEPTNFLTRPGKKGTGYGYIDVTLNKYPGYKSEPYQAAVSGAFYFALGFFPLQTQNLRKSRLNFQRQSLLPPTGDAGQHGQRKVGRRQSEDF